MSGRVNSSVHWSAEASSELGKRVRDLRQELHLSQDALAERAGVSRNLIQALEHGRSPVSDAPANPTIATICAIGSALETGPDRLLRGLS